MSAPPPPLHLFLKDHDATMALGACLGEAMQLAGAYPPLLLDGELGTGKTTFTRGLVQSLPGGDHAEVASPSFNYLNMYPTAPETLHFDFYRLHGQAADGELLDALHEPDSLVIVEWAAYCHPDDLPAERLGIRFSMVSDGRSARIMAQGQTAMAVLRPLRNALSAHCSLHDALQGGDPTCGS